MVISLVCYKIHSKFLNCFNCFFSKIVIGSNFNPTFTLCLFWILQTTFALTMIWDWMLPSSLHYPSFPFIQQFLKCGSHLGPWESQDRSFPSPFGSSTESSLNWAAEKAFGWSQHSWQAGLLAEPLVCRTWTWVCTLPSILQVALK